TDVERHNDEEPHIDAAIEQPEVLHALIELLGPSDPEMVAESYWRATHLIEEVAAQYSAGKLDLPQKALAEQCYFAICRRLHNQLKARQRSHR
ncbi:arginine decarboxylase, partial [Escherichia coli]|nr:arginine decarboxylase [Escherichia coli]